ncbi:hypothetical protein TNCV_3983901 [Trichonephila clavipes]|nr:hypothetical protein TNCV_3983901 [Trichonephila clavipes]
MAAVIRYIDHWAAATLSSVPTEKIQKGLKTHHEWLCVLNCNTSLKRIRSQSCPFQSGVGVVNTTLCSCEIA